MVFTIVTTERHSEDTVACKAATANLADATTVSKNDHYRPSGTVKSEPGQIGDVRVDNEVQTCNTNQYCKTLTFAASEFCNCKTSPTKPHQHYLTLPYPRGVNPLRVTCIDAI